MLDFKSQFLLCLNSFKKTSCHELKLNLKMRPNSKLNSLDSDRLRLIVNLLNLGLCTLYTLDVSCTYLWTGTQLFTEVLKNKTTFLFFYELIVETEINYKYLS